MRYLSEEKLETELLPLSNSFALSFLHGNCQYFALALAKLFPFEIALWMEFDEEVQKMCLVHAFASAIHSQEKKLFIDVKGCRTWEDVKNDFDYWEEPTLVIKDYKGALESLRRIEVPYDDENLIKDAESFIIRNMSHYDTKVKQHDF